MFNLLRLPATIEVSSEEELIVNGIVVTTPDGSLEEHFPIAGTLRNDGPGEVFLKVSDVKFEQAVGVKTDGKSDQGSISLPVGCSLEVGKSYYSFAAKTKKLRASLCWMPRVHNAS